MNITYAKVIETVGEENFKKYTEGFYNLKYILDHKYYNCGRYALYGFLPFYVVNQMYNDAYEKNDMIGSTYDWLEGYPTEDEIKNFPEIVKKYLKGE